MKMSPLKDVISPLAGRNEKTWFAPFEPEKRFLPVCRSSTSPSQKSRAVSYQVCPSRFTFETAGTGCPDASKVAEIGPALMFASQTMISRWYVRIIRDADEIYRDKSRILTVDVCRIRVCRRSSEKVVGNVCDRSIRDVVRPFPRRLYSISYQLQNLREGRRRSMD